MKQICKVIILFLAINLHGEYREVVIIHDFRVEILQEKGVHSDCEEGIRRQLDFIKLVIPERVFQRLSETVFFKCGKHGCARVVQGHPRSCYSPSGDHKTSTLYIKIKESGLANDNLALHELAHAWHHLHVRGGFENTKIQVEWGKIPSGQRALGRAGVRSFYWTKDHTEFFAELSVACLTKHRKKAACDWVHKLWKIDPMHRVSIEELPR